MREAIFDVLSSLGAPAEYAVLDLFAGSGALGIEALSRGAERVIFVDQDRRVTKQIRENLTAVKLAATGRTEIVQSDAIAYCRSRQSVLEEIDLTLCDPPYDYLSWAKLLRVMPGEIVVLESNRSIELPEHLVLHREYRYGGTLVTVAHRREGMAPLFPTELDEEVL